VGRLLIFGVAGMLAGGCGTSREAPRDAGGAALDRAVDDASVDQPVGDAALDLSVEATSAPNCPASIAELCAEVFACPTTWTSAQQTCTHSPLARIATSCGGYDVLSQPGLPDTGSTTFYFDQVSGDLVGVVESAGSVPPPDTNSTVCTIPSSFSAPICKPAVCPQALATTPIAGLTAGTWTWVPFPQAFCRDGSFTGVGVNLGTANRLVIFLEGGGACFNGATCAGNPPSFGSADLQSRAASTMDEIGLGVGILDRTRPANPVKDWTFVYVPYCTGDLHAGNNVATAGDAGGSPQHFVGYANMGVYLDRLVPTFPSVTQVLLTGISAGGFGAAFNYAQVARAFGSAPVTLLDDSGPFMQDPYFASCLQNELRALWGLDGTVLADCGSGCATPGSVFLDAVEHLTALYPKVAFGLADSTDDATITTFYGWGMSSCTGTGPLTEATFTAGLLDIRAQLASQPNFGEFVFAGADHTTIQSAAFYTRVSGAVDGGAGDGGVQADGGPGGLMTDWVAGLLDGGATNTGP
jgi:hypothetical protein